jgi:branched-chain amino acid transport system substrate-binding protein
MKKGSNLFYLILLILCAALLITSCAGDKKTPEDTTPKESGQPVTGDPIKVGLIQPLTGPIAATGIAIRDAAIIYQDYINSHGGVNGRPVELIIEDSANDPTKAASAMTKLCAQAEIPVVIGAWGSSPTLAAMAVAKENNMPMVVETASNWKVTDKTQEGGPLIFRLSAPSLIEVSVLRDILKDKLHFNKPYLISVNNDWGRGNAEEFTDLYENHYGLSVAGSDFVEYTETDYSAVLTKVLASDADSIIVTGDAAQISLIVEQGYNLGIRLPYLGTGMACSIYKISELAGADAAEGFYQTVSFVGNIDPNKTANPEMAKVFVDAWNEKKYELIEMQEGARGFDALYTVCEAIKTIKGDITRDSVREALANLETDTMSFGHVKFTEWGNFINQNVCPVAVIGIKDGKDTVLLDLTYAVYQGE